MVIFKSYCSILKNKFSKIFLDPIFDPNHDPIQFSVNNVEYYGYDTVKDLNIY
jgi:hypothetical protein